MASNPIPQKKALPIFPYTSRGWTIIDVVPYQASYSKIFRAGTLVSYRAATVQNTGYYDKYTTDGQGVALVKEVDLTSPAYTGLADLAFGGIITYDFPENRERFDDQYGDLEVEDRDLGALISTIAGPMARTSMAVLSRGGLILTKFFTSGNPAGAVSVLAKTDINKPVYVSKNNGSNVGSAGYATVDDLSAESGAAKIGYLRELPVIGGSWGYIEAHEPQEVA